MDMTRTGKGRMEEEGESMHTSTLSRAGTVTRRPMDDPFTPAWSAGYDESCPGRYGQSWLERVNLRE